MIKQESSLKTKRGEFKFEITEDDYNELLLLDLETIEKNFEEDRENYKYGLTFREYLYVCLKNNVINSNEIDGLKEKFMDRLDFIENTDNILRLKGRKIDFEINEELEKMIYANMDPNYSLFQKVVYYYFKLCFLLNIDNYYSYLERISSVCLLNFKKDIANLNSIGPNNGNACCYEFAAILNKLIEREGGVVNKLYYGGHGHDHTKCSIDEKCLFFDPLINFDWGITNIDYREVKMGREYNGVVLFKNGKTLPLNDNSEVKKVYDDIQKEFSSYKSKKRFNKETIDNFKEIINSIDISCDNKKIINDYIDKINSIPLQGVEYCSEINNNYNKQLSSESNEDISFVTVCSSIDDFCPELILSIKGNKNQYYYFRLADNDIIEPIPKDTLLEYIEDLKIVISHNNGSYYYIPGIDEQLQEQKNKLFVREHADEVSEIILNKSKGLSVKQKSKKIIENKLK